MSRRRGGLVAAVLLLALGGVGCGLGLASTARTAHAARAVFRPQLPKSGLVTNEYAFWHPGAAGRHESPDWIVTSGSLFATHGAGWTGVPDRVKPNAGSTNGTDSAVFRLISRRRDFRDVRVSFELLVQRHVVPAGTIRHGYDGVHVWLRYGSETRLYALSVMRWDGKVVIKRKTSGGPSNGGSYRTLASTPRRVRIGRWIQVTVEAVNRPAGVELAIKLAGRLVLRYLDRDARALTAAGGVGIRGDNTELEFRDFEAISP